MIPDNVTTKKHLVSIVLAALQKFIPGVLFTQNDEFDDGAVIQTHKALQIVYNDIFFSFLKPDFLRSK